MVDHENQYRTIHLYIRWYIMYIGIITRSRDAHTAR